MRKLSFLSLLLLIITACNGQKDVQDSAYAVTLNGLLEHNVKEISVSEAAKDQNSYLFLDARETKEFDISHIRNAIWVGYTSFNLNSVKNIDKSKKIIVYCSVGYRSEKITQKLAKTGFTNVYNLYGGIFEWINEGNDIYDSNVKTSRIHAYDKSWGIWLKKGVKVY